MSHERKSKSNKRQRHAQLKNSLVCLDLRERRGHALDGAPVGRRGRVDAFALRLQLVDERVYVFRLPAKFHRFGVGKRLPNERVSSSMNYFSLEH